MTKLGTIGRNQLTLAILFFCTFLIEPVFGQDPFTIRGDAVRRSKRCFTVTSDQNQKSGAVWFRDLLDLSQPLELNFVIYMGDKNNNGADGIAFVMHTDPLDTAGAGAFGDVGGGLGYSRHHSQTNTKQITPSVAIEFDTWNNGGSSGDIAEDHTAVVYNGDVYNGTQLIMDDKGDMVNQTPIKPSAIYAVQNVENDECYHYRITWNPTTQVMELFIDGYKIFTFTDDIINNVFSGTTDVRYGFTGSTGGARNEQTICLFGGNTPPYAQNDFAVTPEETPVTVNITANDNDPDGDDLLKSVIVDYPTNGSVNILNPDNLEYTPNTGYVGQDSLTYMTCDVNSVKCYAKCDTATVLIDVQCVPYDIDAIQLSPNDKCDDSFPDNGVAQASFTPPASGPGSGFTSADFTFRWYEGGSVKATPDYTGAIINNFSTGLYTVVAENNYTGCLSNPTQVTIDSTANTPDAVIWQVSSFTSCGIPDGELQAGVLNGSDTITAGYDFIWYENDFVYTGDTVAIGGVAAYLQAKKYAVAITNQTSGCDTLLSLEVPSNVTIPLVSAGVVTHITQCTDPLAGEVLADVGGNTAGYDFAWYNGGAVKPVGDHTGNSVDDLSAGNYTVTATDNATSCTSDPVTVNVQDLTTSPTVLASVTSQQESCDPNNPTGAVTASVDVGGTPTTSGYSFYWYDGPNDVVPAIPGQTGGSASNCGSGGSSIPGEIWLEAECGSLGSKWQQLSDTEASGGTYVRIQNGNNSLGSAPSGVNDRISYTFNVAQAGDYIVWGRVIATNGGNDSFWVRIDGGTWIRWNEIAKGSIWQWDEVHDADNGKQVVTFNLSAGNHTLDIAFREDGTLLDKLFITNNNSTPSNGTPGATLSGLSAGTYRVVAIENATGCKAVQDVTIIDNTVTPVITVASTTDQTHCAPTPNGSASVHVGGNTTDYDFYWYNGTIGAPDTTSSSVIHTNASFNNLTAGDYTVVAAHKQFRCVSAPTFITINDNTAVPTINTSVVSEQTACDPLLYNGQLAGSVDASAVGGGATDTNNYTFEWYAGVYSLATLPATPTATGANASGLAGGDYTLVVTNDTSQCQNLAFINLPDNPVKPLIDAAITVVDANSCADPWGSSIAATADGGMTSADGYTFQWTQVATSTVLPDTIETISNIPPGDYEVLVTSNLGCVADNPETVTVQPATDPVINTSVVSEQTACDPLLYNGQLVGSVDASAVGGGATDTNDYTFEWYNGVYSLATLPATPTATGANASGLAGGDYTLVVTNDTSQCQNLAFINLPDNPVKPVIDATINVVHANRCADPWGSSIAVTADGGMTSADGYTFQWTQVATSTVLAETSETLSNIPPGDYEVLVTSNLGCVADNAETITVQDIAPKPTASLAVTHNTSCDPVANPNGIIIASGFTGAATDYTFEWFENNTSGAAVNPANINPDGTIASSLITQTYALRLTETSTACPIVVYETVNAFPASPPIVDTVSTTPTTNCNVGNGSAEFTLVSGIEMIPPANTNPRTYHFHLEELASGNITTISNTTGTANFTSLIDGNYEMIVEDDFTKCTSAPFAITIERDPQINIVINQNPPSSCDPLLGGDGVLNISASSSTNASPSGAGYTFTWSRIDDVTGLPLPVLAFGGTDTDFSSERVNLSTSYYIIETLDKETNCSVADTFYLPPADPPLLTIENITNTTGCINDDGEVEIKLETQPSTLFGLTSYQVLVFEGSSPTLLLGGQIDSWTPANATDTNHTFTNLPDGNYTIAVKELLAPFCWVAQEPATIGIDITSPTITISEDTPDFSCNATGTGELSALAVGDGDGDNTQSNFSFAWYAGTGTGGALLSNTATANTLSAGTYTVQVTDNDGDGNGCVSTKSVNLSKQLKTIAITDTDIVDQNQCNPANGEISVEEVQEDGTPVAALGTYNFTILDDSYASPGFAYSGSGTNADPFGDLPADTYYLVATNTATDCSSSPAQTIVDDVSQDPVPAISLTSPDFSCAGGAATGELLASAEDPVSGDTTNFTYTWFIGNNTVTPIPAANIDAVNPAHTFALDSGQYTVRVTDTDGTGEGCYSSKTFTINRLKRTQTLSMISSDQDRCAPDVGAITTIEVTETDAYNGTVLVNLVNYDFQLFDSDPNNAISVLGASTSFIGLAPGEYHVKGTSRGTDNCESLPFDITINDVSEDPEINISLIQPDFSCDGVNPTGELTAVGSDPKDGATTAFSYKWFVGADTTGADISLTADASSLLKGTYTVKVIDTDGTGDNCESTKTITLNGGNRKIDLALSSAPQTICSPNGTITVDQATEEDTFNGTQPASLTNYDFYLYQDPAAASIDTAATNSFNDLGMGTYFVRGHNTGTDGCISLPFSVNIKDVSKNPIVSIDEISKQMSINPDPATWTGELAALIAEHPNNPLDSTANGFNYGYAWYDNDDYNPGAEISMASSASQLDSGLYVLEVTNNVTNCSSAATYFLRLGMPEILAAYTGLPQTICFPDGGIEVDNITVNAVAANVSDYTFSLYTGGYPGDTTFTVDGALTGTLIYDSLDADENYYMVAYDKNLMMNSEVVQVDIENLSTSPVVDLDLAQSQDQNSCDPTILLNGILAVNVYETDYTQDTYRYQWFTGKGTDSTYIMNDSTDAIIRGLGAGHYSVWVENQQTGCTNETSFFVNEDIRIPEVASSSAPSTYCGENNGNGTVVAYVSNPTSTYSYEWFEGTEVKSQADHTGEVWDNLDPGFTPYGLPTGELIRVFPHR